MVAMKNPHRGGEQLPLLVPPTTWSPPAELPDLLGRGVTHMALDTETCDHRLGRDQGPGWPYRDGYVCGFSAAWRQGAEMCSIYVPLRHPDTPCFSVDQVRGWLQHNLRSVRPVFQNSHYDVGWMRTIGIEPNYPIEDTQCQAFVLEENHLRYDLDSICERLGIPGKDEALLREALAVYGWPSKGRQAKANIYRLPARYVGPYAQADAAQTLEAWEIMQRMLHSQYSMGKNGPVLDLGVQQAYRTEMDLVPCVHRMQYDGVRVNVDRAQQRADALYQARDETLAELGRQLGETVVVDSINRGDWLEKRFDAAGIPYPRTEPTGKFPDGQPSFTAGSTGWMHKHPHWLPQLIVRAEKQHKAAKDFLEGFVVKPAHNGRIHANINQFKGEDAGGTRTHRFSYADPPLQQMPSRDEELMDAVRGCFEPEDGEEWVSCDYCYDDETEILTEEGWVPFPSLGDQRVAQWDSGVVSFVAPTDKYVGKLTTRQMHSVVGERQVNFCVTASHRCLLLDRKTKSKQMVVLGQDLRKHLPHNFIPQSGLLPGGRDDVPVALIQMIAALQADAADRPLKYGNEHWAVKLKKQRKIERLVRIAKDLGVFYDVKILGEWTWVRIKEDKRYREYLAPGKLFRLEALLGLSPRLREVFLDELRHWDGSGAVYSSVERHNCDAVQVVAAVTNRRAAVRTQKEPGRTQFGTRLLSSTTVSKRTGTWGVRQMKITEETKRGRVYCVTVPSGFVITRREGHVVVSGNSQQEYRLIVHFAQVLELPRSSVAGDRYRADPNTDYHTMVAEMTGLDRKPAKDANFAKAFGAGVDKFAAMINKTREEAAAIMEQYDRELPFVSALAKTVQGAADRRGYVRLIDGARLHYEQWEPAWRDWKVEQRYKGRGGLSGTAPCERAEAEKRIADSDHPWSGKRLRRAFTRKAGNGLIQGSAARMTKIAMVLAHREGIKLRLQVHDELNASVARREEGERLAEIMTHAVRLTVPIVVKAEYGASWGDVE